MYVKHPLIKPNTIEFRLYQEKIFAEAVKRNTLVVLPTGLGKTAIALLLAANRLPKGRVIMLAPTKPLVQQHVKSFMKTIIGEVAEISGHLPPKKRMELWNTKIICATPQTLRNDLMRGVKLDDVSLLIFDEAHRAVGDYAYAFIAGQYIKQSKDPLILGLTASPGSETVKIKEVCENLFIQNIELRQHNDPDVVGYVKPMEIDWKKVVLPKEMIELKSILKDCLRDPVRKLKKLGFLASANLEYLKKRELIKIQAIAQRDRNYQALSSSAAAIKLMHALELLETQGVRVLSEYIEKLKKDKTKAAKAITEDYFFYKVLDKLKKMQAEGVEHPKQRLLLRLVAGRCIVFSNYKSQAKRIVELIKKEKGYKAELLVGRSGMTQKKQKEIVEKFKQGEIDVLVTTSVGEEGLDIPSVDLVIFYEPVPSGIRSIQRKGRTARHRPGKVIILVTKGTRDEAYLFAAEYKQKEMIRTLKSVTLPSKTESQKTLDTYQQIEKGKVVVFVDSREAGSTVVSELRNLVEVRLIKLPVGDYLCSDRVAIERKTAKDFVSSIIDKRLFEQVVELKKHYVKPILLIEGTDLYSHRAIHPNAIRGALVALAVDLGVPVIFSSGAKDSAGIITMFARREQEKKRFPSLLTKKKALTVAEQQIRLVSSLPSVGELLAERLLEYFGTPEQIFNASEGELSKVEKMGPKKAEAIKTVLTKEWGSE